MLVLGRTEPAVDVLEADPAQHGDAVPAAVAVVRGLVAERRRTPARGNAVVGLLGLLHAQNIGLVRVDPVEDPRHASGERVDVPSRQAHRPGHSVHDTNRRSASHAVCPPTDAVP